ncbi:MAG: hypothetical protein EBR59_11280, partial [Methylococcaceae bacterium]|nr:hypothetical protein [Methylococcaceae bacterium]
QSNILPNLTKASDNFNLVFFTVTPDEKTMIVNLLSNITSSNNPTSLREWAAEINPLATQLVALNLCHLSGLNMISEDWPRDEDIQHIIAWNHTVPTKRPCYHP